MFDQNLSRKLVNRLADILSESSHMPFHGLGEKIDTGIWEFAKQKIFCILTQDIDFPRRSRLPASPTKDVWQSGYSLLGKELRTTEFQYVNLFS
ncbi:MAG: DUF5615 family PIN-like protein [Cyanobacteria bacterium J06636_16]